MKIEGFSAISWANGWEIALLGFFVVFLSVGLLVVAISMVHLGLIFSEKKRQQLEERRKNVSFDSIRMGKLVVSPARGDELRVSWCAYAMLAGITPAPLSLPALLDAAFGRGIRHCHAVMADLLKSGVLKPDGKGYYLWDQALFDALMGEEKDRSRA